MNTVANILGWALVSVFGAIVVILTVFAAGEAWWKIRQERAQLPPHQPPETDVRELS